MGVGVMYVKQALEVCLKVKGSVSINGRNSLGAKIIGRKEYKHQTVGNEKKLVMKCKWREVIVERG